MLFPCHSQMCTQFGSVESGHRGDQRLMVPVCRHPASHPRLQDIGITLYLWADAVASGRRVSKQPPVCASAEQMGLPAHRARRPQWSRLVAMTEPDFHHALSKACRQVKVPREPSSELASQEKMADHMWGVVVPGQQGNEMSQTEIMLTQYFPWRGAVWCALIMSLCFFEEESCSLWDWLS